MSDKILYEEIKSFFEVVDKPTITNCITQNIKQPLREYQKEALENFIFYLNNKKYKNKDYKHLLFHMATGSGKTNVIASVILYLYERGYRYFIFFVNSINIISKTKENLLNQKSSKYLFKNQIKINNRQININVIDDTFDSAKKDDINILFTTIQGLHIDLETTIKENSITYADFEDKKIVLIADEAHHLNSEFKKGNKSKEDEENIKSWGITSKKLLKTNKENLLLEFTATAELNTNLQIKQHYQDKIIAEYPFKKFRDDGYSKDVILINDGLSQKQRILQAIMISEYRQIIAQKELNIYIKPIIMFKNPKGIKNIDKNFDDFIKLIENLKVSDIVNILQNSKIKAIKKLKEIIKDDIQSFINRLKYSFSSNKCLVIYSTSKDKEEKLKLLNSLEDKNNHIRAIFAVNVLNEGWDVLNLFDIVKLDENNTSNTYTTAEAQLIGRGARYYPFEYNDMDKYKRKFKDINQDLIILEEMYFYSINDNKYIKSLQNKLKDFGFANIDEKKIVKLKLKNSFLEDELYKKGVIYVNDYQNINKASEIFGIDYYAKNYKYNDIKIDNSSNEIVIFDDEILQKEYNYQNNFMIIDDIDLIRIAMNKKPFFYFANLKKYFPNIKSISQFITDNNYLGKVKFILNSTEKLNLDDELKIEILLSFLDNLQSNIIKNSRTKRGLKIFTPVRISHKIKKEKELKLTKANKNIIINQDWYVFEEHFGTDEESTFVDFISNSINQLKSKYDDIKLIRNERELAIYAIDDMQNGDRFEPDFILLLKSKDGCYHQIFCEPKGNWTKDDNDSFEHSKEKWKEKFLKDITNLTNANELKLKSINDKDSLKLYENECYKLFGLPFYNSDNQDNFIEEFEKLVLK